MQASFFALAGMAASILHRVTGHNYVIEKQGLRKGTMYTYYMHDLDC